MLGSSRIVTVGAGVAAAVVLSVLPAAATPARATAPPRHGETYKGHVANAPPEENVVTFSVSKNGRWVRAMLVGPYVLNRCGVGDLPPPMQSTHPARIRRGEFTAHVVYRREGHVVARTTVTGKFLPRGRESGVVNTNTLDAPPCRESPHHYTTHAQ